MARFKAFLALLLTALVLGLGQPQSAFGTGPAITAKACCCTGNAVCACHPSAPCPPSCARVQVRNFDAQVPLRAALVALHAKVLLSFIIPARTNDPALDRVPHRRDLNASPPFGGSPPQALLRLWLI